MLPSGPEVRFAGVAEPATGNSVTVPNVDWPATIVTVARDGDAAVATSTTPAAVAVNEPQMRRPGTVRHSRRR
jgi:hypothetical protein